MFDGVAIMDQSFSYTYHSQSVSYKKIGTGKPLLILHGWGSSSRVMMPVAKALSNLRTCYMPDLPGFGDSPAPDRSWSIDDYTDLIELFIQDLELEKVDILAHSFGGRITLKLCARIGSRSMVDKVIITGGAGMKPRRSMKFYFKKYLAKSLKAPFLVLPKTLQKPALSWLRSTLVWRSIGSKEYSELSGVMRETFVKSVSEYLEPCLPHISKEVLLIWGEHDEATPLYQARRMENGLKKGALVVIEKAGHYSFLDRPKYFASIVKAFLNG